MLASALCLRLPDRTRRTGHAAPAVVESRCPAARSRAPTETRATPCPVLDWQALPGRRARPPQPRSQAPRTHAFTGGSKEDQPGLVGLDHRAGGVNPGKANILDAWSSFDPQGGDAFLYLGFAREAASLLAGRRRPRAATTFITFELNHDPRLWDNGQATIPCRSTGDVLVSYEARATMSAS